MDLRKLLCLSLLFTLFAAAPVLAQTPDTTTLKIKKYRFNKAIVVTKDGNQYEGFMAYHYPYSPVEQISLVPLDGNTKNTVTYKIKNVETLAYADLRYEQIFPDNDRQEYLARVAAKGDLNLYTFTELEKAPAIIPVAGLVRVISIPYNQSFFFIEKDSKIMKIDRAKYKEQLLEYVGNNAELARKIKDKTYKYKDIETIIKTYNAGVSKP